MTEPLPEQKNTEVNPNQLDLVVIGFTGELRLLQLQARSIRLYANEATFNRIFIVVNDNDYLAFKAFFETEILPEYGPHADRVDLMDYRSVTGKPYKKTGWRSQQALKLMMARHVEADQYLILDSKNHFIRPVDQSCFMAPDGRLRTHVYPVIAVFEAYFEAACAYFGVQYSEARPTIMPTSPPFMVARGHACALIDLVEAREGTAFFTFFMENRQYTEFYFYYAYLCSFLGAFEQTYCLSPKPNVTFFSSVAGDNQKLVDSSKALDDPSVYLLGVHRRIFEEGLAANLSTINQLWRRFGLVSNDTEAAYFQAIEGPKKRKKFIFF